MGKLFGVEIVAMQICNDYKSNFPNQTSYTRSVIWGLKFSSSIHPNTYKRERSEGSKCAKFYLQATKLSTHILGLILEKQMWA